MSVTTTGRVPRVDVRREVELTDAPDIPVPYSRTDLTFQPQIMVIEYRRDHDGRYEVGTVEVSGPRRLASGKLGSAIHRVSWWSLPNVARSDHQWALDVIEDYPVISEEVEPK